MILSDNCWGGGRRRGWQAGAGGQGRKRTLLGCSCTAVVQMDGRGGGTAQGLSTELGAFMAGVMLSATEQQDSALHQLENIKGFFLSLFICSTGLVMSPVFLAAHMRVLAGGVLLTVLAKTVVVRPSPPHPSPPPSPPSAPLCKVISLFLHPLREDPPQWREEGRGRWE